MKRANTDMRLPAHHDGNRFRNPWPGSEMHGVGGLIKWMLTRSRNRNGADAGHHVIPAIASTVNIPERSQSLTLSWIGHSTFLIQCDGLNILTDPVWSDRASPLSFVGPHRLLPPPLPIDQLPPIDITLISHDHYDHLDSATVTALSARFPDMQWIAPLKVAAFLTAHGAERITELDWWEETHARGIQIGCTPARHFSGRYPWNRNATLWCGFTLKFSRTRAYFAGDTALHPGFAEIASRFGPFDVVILPIGAYEPRWFMRAVHMTPEDSVLAYNELITSAQGMRCVMAGGHWGTFHLTDEPVMEPPHLTRATWTKAGHPAADLWIFQHGETRSLEGA